MDKDETKIKKIRIPIIISIVIIGLVLGYIYKSTNQSGPVYVMITVDVERDLVPYLDTYNGITEGVPVILDILKEHGITATFFVTGNVAERYPYIVEQIADEGHEIGGQGHMHERLYELDYDEKYDIINKTTALLKEFDVKVFRSPYQSVDTEVIDILEEFGYCAEGSYEDYEKTHIITHTTNGQIKRSIVRITSEPLFYPSTTYPKSWIDVYDEALEYGNKIIVVGIHSWEVLELPDVEDAEEYVVASGNYTHTNLVNLLDYLEQKTLEGENIRFLTAKEVCELFLE